MREETIDTEDGLCPYRKHEWETKATNGAPYHVEGRTVVMTTRSGKSLPVAACDFLSAEYVCAALSAYWESENERGAMFAFEERGDGK